MEPILEAVLVGSKMGRKRLNAEKPYGVRIRQIGLPASHVRGLGFESPHLHKNIPTPRYSAVLEMAYWP
jgi:hypothetical protein